MERLQIINHDEKGNKIIYEVMATYHDEETNKDYVVYTDGKIIDNKLNILYSLYKIEENKIKLIETTNPSDKKVGLMLIEELIKDMK